MDGTLLNGTLQQRLIRFLEDELKLPTDAIAIALRQGESLPTLMPMVLWQYGLVTIEQLAKIFDWLEAA
jgi:hypothetical protein